MTIQEAKQVFEMAVERIQRILASTPDERLHWSPAELEFGLTGR